MCEIQQVKSALAPVYDHRYVQIDIPCVCATRLTDGSGLLEVSEHKRLRMTYFLFVAVNHQGCLHNDNNVYLSKPFSYCSRPRMIEDI